MYKLLKLYLLLCFPVEIYAQITIQTNLPLSDVVQRLVGNGIYISNISVDCHADAYGNFTSDDVDFGLRTGLILTTGLALEAIGPNNSQLTSTTLNRGGDPQLTHISGIPTFDACIIEFDVIPSTNELRFNYVFASEEYNEYTCANINDLFAFFISGPGISGDKNIALIPNTNIPVSINTINNGRVGSKVSNINSNCNLNNTIYYFDNTNGKEIEYDGFVSNLEAKINVIPCQTYHLKLKIADGGDGRFDSGVFIENVNSNEYELSYTTPDNSNNIPEGCQMKIKLKKIRGIGKATTVNLLYGGKATYGVDYNALPTTVSFDVGDIIKTLDLTIFSDKINDKGENFIFKIATNSCNGIISNDSIEIFIKEYNLGNDTTLCEGELLLLSPGNFGNTRFLWQDGSTNPTFTVSSAGVYHVIIQQEKCETIYDTIVVNYDAEPKIELGRDTTLCIGQTFLLDATVEGNATYLWQDGSTDPIFEVNTQGIYYVLVQKGACSIIDSIRINYRSLPIPSFTDTVICFFENLLCFQEKKRKIVRLEPFITYNKEIYNWSTGANTNYIDIKQPGIYKVQVSDNFCKKNYSFNVKEKCSNLICFPTAFLPESSDNVNAIFKGIGEEVKDFELIIYNRWGGIIFYTKSQDQGWDGNFKGKPMPSGIYPYKYIYTNKDNTIKKGHGSVTLIR